MVSTTDFESVILGSSPSKSCCLPDKDGAHIRYGLVVRIEGFHPFGRGSIPRIGIRALQPTNELLFSEK